MQYLSSITEPSIWASLATLTCLEIVLGIDNLVFITVVTVKLPERDQPKARVAGLLLALLTRVVLLFCISWLTTLTAPWFHLFGRTWSAKDIVLLSAGLFLIAKGTRDIHERWKTPNGESLRQLIVECGEPLSRSCFSTSYFRSIPWLQPSEWLNSWP